MPEATIDGIGWYVALGYYKQAVTLEVIHARYLLGMTVGEGFDHFRRRCADADRPGHRRSRGVTPGRLRVGP